MDHLHKSDTSQTHRAVKCRKKKPLIFFFLSPLERKKNNRWVGGVKQRAQRAARLTVVVGVVDGFHRVAVVLGEETPGGVALVQRTPAASSLLATDLVEGSKVNQGAKQNRRRLEDSFSTTLQKPSAKPAILSVRKIQKNKVAPWRLRRLESSPLSVPRGCWDTQGQNLEVPNTGNMLSGENHPEVSSHWVWLDLISHCFCRSLRPSCCFNNRGWKVFSGLRTGFFFNVCSSLK